MLLTDIYTNSQIVEKINSLIHSSEDRIHVHGMTGSLSAIVAATIALLNPDRDQLIIAGNKEEAYYMLNDIEMLLEETDADFDQKRALLFPSSYRKPRRKSPQSGAPDQPPHVDDDGGDLPSRPRSTTTATTSLPPTTPTSFSAARWSSSSTAAAP